MSEAVVTEIVTSIINSCNQLVRLDPRLLDYNIGS